MIDRRLRAAIALAAGLALVAAMLWYIGPSHVGRALSSASPIYLALAIVAYGLFFLVRGIRWRMLFSHSAPDVRLTTTTGATAVGWLANSLLPLKGGEVLRATLVARRERVSIVTSAATIALERVLDMLGASLLAVLALLLLPGATHLPGWLVLALQAAWILPVALLLALAALVRWRELSLRGLSRATRHMGRFGVKVHTLADMVLSGFATLARHPGLLARLAPLTFVIATLQTLVFAFLVMAFIPPATLAMSFAGSAIFLLSFVIAITPGNVGTYEAAFIAVFVALGVPAEVAIPASILTHLTTTLIVAAAGGCALVVLGLGARGALARPPDSLAKRGVP